MLYTIYEITNKINGKIYVGKHQTDDIDDDYMGSGKLIRIAIEKYGIENFEKKILFILDSEEEMNAKESEVVTEEFCDREDTYNLCPGGRGGFGYINSAGINNTNKNMKAVGEKISSALAGRHRPDISESLKDQYASGRRVSHLPNWKGREHKKSTKSKISAAMSTAQQGRKNSQFGTMWITDGIESKKIKRTDTIPEGWYRGRN